MINITMRWFIQVVMIWVVMGFVSGCRREPVEVEEVPSAEPDAIETTAAAQAPSVDVEAEAPERAASPFPDAELPPHLKTTQDMPSGPAKGRAVEKAFLEQALPKVQAEVLEANKKVSQAEKEARRRNPELGRLYKELIDKRIEYRKALEANEAYQEAKKASRATVERYGRLIERQKIISEEMSDDN